MTAPLCEPVASRSRRSAALLRSLLVTLFIPACGHLAAGPITDNPVFAMLAGKWEGQGELVNTADGFVTQVKETWSGELTETGNFTMSGKRLFDQNEHEFAWEFFANGDLIEGQMKVTDPQLDLRFEAQVNEASRSVTLKVGLSGGGGVMTIVNTVSGDGLTIEGTVEIVDDTGKTTTTGKVTHRKS